jgi:AmmeMemoRadiSam system protein A
MAPLHPADAARLFDIAEEAIRAGLAGQRPTAPQLDALPDALRAPIGVFVTLLVGGELNGCIGSIEGTEPLAHAVARHAWNAAFRDPRLPALRPEDWDRLTIEISVLSPLTPMPAHSRAELLAALRPGIDGLVIVGGGRQAVFLPVVWEQLPNPDDFLDYLQRKAGMAPRSWPADMRGLRFTAEKLARRAQTPSTGISTVHQQ